MASLVHMEGLKRLIDPTRSAAATVKATLVMSNTTSDTEQDVADVDAFTTLDECDATGYTWGHGGDGRQTLTVATTRDDSNDEIELQISSGSGTTTWTLTGAPTRQVTGVLILIAGTSDDTDAYPIKYEEVTGPSGAGTYVHTWNAEGPIKLALP